MFKFVFDGKYKIRKLFQLGHFFNPNHPNTHNITLKNLDTLTMKDGEVVEALESFKVMMGEDNDDEVFNIPRCGQEDYPDPNLLNKIGSGSWPEPCQKAGITFSLSKSGMPSKYTSTFDTQILAPVIATYAKMGLKIIPYTGSGKANIRVAFISLAGSTIGMAEFNNRSCSDSVFCHLDTGYSPNEFTEAELLCHEMGHNMNLQHTNGGIMHPSLSNKSAFNGWVESDPSYKTLVKFFGGEPIDNLPNPTPGSIVKNLSVKLTPGTVNVSSMELDFNKSEMIIQDSSGKQTKYAFINNLLV